MTRKYISVFTLAIAGATTAFAQITLNPVPSRSIGSPALSIYSTSPNLVEGRELSGPQSIAIDTSVSPPILYVSDTANNRVLAWKDAGGFQSGQKADLQVGQPDLLTTFPGGPGTAYSTGLSRPTGIAVYKGDLYVADSGNNRVLRYPNPFNQVNQQGKQFPIPDMWIGQATSSSRLVNFNGQPTPNAQGIFLTNGTNFLQSTIAFDSAGNLWMADAGNFRVLRFKASDVISGGGGLTADLELGQLDLNSLQTQLSGNDPTAALRTNQFFLPATVAFDPSGNLFVTDFNGTTVNRVLVFVPPFSTDMSASKLMGVFPSTFVPPTDPHLKQTLQDNTQFLSLGGVFFIGGNTPAVGVVDSGSSRILLFDAYANWPTDGTPPVAKSIFGQANTCPTAPLQLQLGLPSYALCRAVNNANPRPSANTLAGPVGVFATATDVFVADTANNRVLDLPISGNTLSSATRVLGQDRMDTNSVNLIEGREFNFSVPNLGSDAGIAIDNSTGTPHLYVADPGNNRVLGFKDVRNLKPGARADLVIGQPDMQTALVNYPANDATKPTSSSLYRPIGVTVDPQGNLYVADSLNSRVLRFPAPFSYSGPTPEPADLVLGQQNFTSKIPDATSSTMLVPYGVAFSGTKGLVVSDQADNRVLYFAATNGTFAAGTDNGKAATYVFGQQSFNSIGTGTDLTSMNNPHGISCDSSGFVYVADTNNNRVLIFNDPNNPSTRSGEAASTQIPGLNTPQGVFVSQLTGEIWVANSNTGTLLRYAGYNSVVLGNGSISSLVDSASYNGTNITLAPLAVTQDQYGALYVADTANRVAFYFPGLNACNGATFQAAFPSKAPNLCAPFDVSANGVTLNAHPLAPGVLATVFPCANCAGDQFGDVTGVFNGTYPMPFNLSDVQVTVDGVPAPLYYVGAPIPPAHPSGQINFVVPNTARTVGNADVEVIRVSTGQVLGATLVPMAPTSPGMLICSNPTAAPYRGACILNQDNTVNSPSNPAPRGTVISIYATGQGFVPGAPSDGSSPGALSAPTALTVFINATDVNGYSGESGQHILYSGLDGYPGVWQINVLIPQGVTPASAENSQANSDLIAIVVNGTANYDTGLNWKTVFWVK
jgi:uncharacterized protein (TIGR03437 family)